MCPCTTQEERERESRWFTQLKVRDSENLGAGFRPGVIKSLGIRCVGRLQNVRDNKTTRDRFVPKPVSLR